MNDSDTPIELDALGSGGSNRKAPSSRGMILATVLGAVSAVAIFFLIRDRLNGNDHPGEESPPAAAGSAKTTPAEADAKPSEIVDAGQAADKPAESAKANGDGSYAEPISIANSSQPEPAAGNAESKPSAPSEESSSKGKPADEGKKPPGKAPQLPDSVKNLSLGPTIDLLEQFDAQKDTVEGSFKKVDGSIVSEKERSSTLVFPDRIPENYVMRLKLKVLDGDDTMYLRVRVKEHLSDLVINGWHSAMGGLDQFDKMEASNPRNETRYVGRMVGSDRPSDLIVVVKGNSLLVTIDGKKIVDWNGDPARLTGGNISNRNTPECVMIRTIRTRWEISQFLLNPIEDVPRLALPDKSEVERKTKALEEQLGFNFRVKKQKDQFDLAQKLRALSETESDALNHYVLLWNALHNASGAGDLKLSFEIIERLAAKYDVSASDLKQTAIKDVARVYRDAVSSYQLSGICTDLAWESADRHEYGEALEFLNLSLDEARRSRVKPLIGQLNELTDLFEVWKKAYESVKKSHAAIEKKTAEDADRLSWGKFLCLVREHWREGLPFLRECGTSPLADAARKELERPEQFNPIIELSREWIALAKEFDEKEKTAIETHARQFAMTAFPWAEKNERLLLDEFSRELFATNTIWDTTSRKDGLAIGGGNANPPAEATVEFWMRTSDKQGGCINKREMEPNGCLLVNVAQGNAVVGVNGSLYYETSASQSYVSDGQWHHIAIAKMGKQLRLFVDGIPVAALTARDGFPKPNSGQWHIGNFKWVQNQHLAAEFTLIRVSAVCRYHVHFVPDRQYKADRATLMLQ